MSTYRIKQTKWDNWYGYEGNRKVAIFADSPTESAEQQAQRWLRERIGPQHHPEPWQELDPYTDRPCATPIGSPREDGALDIIAEAHGCNHQLNARRIIACVNACKGITDPAEALQLARNALQWAIKSLPEGPRHEQFIKALEALGGNRL